MSRATREPLPGWVLECSRASSDEGRSSESHRSSVAEQLFRKQQVNGSNPFGGSIARTHQLALSWSLLHD